MPYKDKEKYNEWRRQFYHRRREDHNKLGLCIDIYCNQPHIKSSVYCLFHLDYFKRKQRYVKEYNPFINEKGKVYQRERRARLKSENKCIQCAMPLNEESRMGIYCLACYSKAHGFY